MPVNLPEQKKEIMQTEKHLSFAEEKAISEKISRLEDVKDKLEIKDAQGVNYEVRDEKALEAQLQNLKSIRSTQSVERVTGDERIRLEKEEKLLREKLDPKMSWNEYMTTKRSDGMKYIRLVRTIERWNSDPVRQRDIKRWKFLRRRLDPDDPDTSNVMNLFRE